MKKRINGLLALLLVLVTQFTFAQDMTISGVVSDSNGLPVPGANVKVKGSSTGTSTDFDGTYKIKARSNDVLVYSYQGMNSLELKVSGAKMNARLSQKSTELEGVIVTALGIKKSEKAVGYAAQSVKGASLTEARESNLVNALSGKISGVQVTNSSGAVGASSRIVLRGATSLTGSNEPLFVVDGIPFDNSSSADLGYNGLSNSAAGSAGGRDLPNGAASINPDDIESVTVLKGPNAAALYGIRASNGVILITTKSGKKGKGLSVASFNSNITLSTPLVIPDFQNSYGQGSTSDFFQFVDGAGGGANDGVDESWGPALDKGLSFVQWDSYKVGGAPRPWVSKPNNVKDFYGTGFTVSNSLSLTAGSDDANMRLSFGHSDEKGMIPNTDFRKFNISFNGSAKLGERLTANASVLFFNDKSNNLPTGGYNNENVAQQFIWSARNTDFQALKDYQSLPLAPSNTAAAGTPISWNNNFQNNPYWVLNTNLNAYKRDRVTGSGSLGYQFSNTISATGKVSIDHFSQETSGIQAKGTNSAPNGSYGVNILRYNEINSEAILSYKPVISDKIGFSINAGGNIMNRMRAQSYGSLAGLELVGLYNLSNAKNGTTSIVGNQTSENRINSVFSFGQVSFKQYVFIDFSARNDWSSKFADKNNSFFYPAVTGSFVLSEILGMTNPIFNYLKLRAGYAEVGGEGALNNYRIKDIYSLANNGFGTQAFLPSLRYNGDIRPEKVVGKELGLDFNAFSNRLRFSGTIYSKKSLDLIVEANVSSTSGYLRSLENAGEMLNSGYELQLGITPIKLNNFSFDIDLNFAQNKNEVVSLGSGLETLPLGAQWGMTLEARVGQPYGVIVGRGFEKDASGKVIYVNGLPQIQTERKVLGDINPDWTGGANFSIKYKNFDFSTLLDAKIGGDVHSMTYAWGRYAGTLIETVVGRENGIIGQGVMSDGAGGFVTNNVVVDAKTFNQNSYGNTIEESAVFDASYVKLRQITVGYSLPKKWLTGSVVSDFKFSIVARNLAILYRNTPHIDPETGFGNSNGEQGQEFGQIPSARSIGFNLNVKF